MGSGTCGKPIVLRSDGKNSYFNLYSNWYQSLRIRLAGPTAAKPDVRYAIWTLGHSSAVQISILLHWVASLGEL